MLLTLWSMQYFSAIRGSFTWKSSAMTRLIQAIVTNIDYLISAEIFNDYNQRCTVGTSIDEIKSGFAFSENSQLNIHQLNKVAAHHEVGLIRCA